MENLKDFILFQVEKKHKKQNVNLRFPSSYMT